MVHKAVTSCCCLFLDPNDNLIKSRSVFPLRDPITSNEAEGRHSDHLLIEFSANANQRGKHNATIRSLIVRVVIYGIVKNQDWVCVCGCYSWLGLITDQDPGSLCFFVTISYTHKHATLLSLCCTTFIPSGLLNFHITHWCSHAFHSHHHLSLHF